MEISWKWHTKILKNRLFERSLFTFRDLAPLKPQTEQESMKVKPEEKNERLQIFKEHSYFCGGVNFVEDAAKEPPFPRFSFAASSSWFTPPQK